MRSWRRAVGLGGLAAIAVACSIDREGGLAPDDAGVAGDAYYSARDAGPRDAAPVDAGAPPDVGSPIDVGPPPPDVGPPDGGCPGMLWYADGDDDGYGAGAAVTSCEEPSMHAGVAGDCDDADARRHPGAAETCDTFDQDCDGLADEGAPCRSGCEVRHRDTRPYLFCDTPDRHRDAITACPTGYELTTIDDAIEDAWVASNARGIRATGWWIGYYDADEDGVYAWVSGTSAYTGWGPREPSGGTEHCALIAWYGTGANSWNDGDCDFDFPFVCESLR